MKLRKLMAALVVVTIMLSSVVFGATTTTTTTYNVATSTFDVKTVVAGADSASRLTYVLYNGATPDENNIIYIDQHDGSKNWTFTVKDVPAAKFISADVIANDDVTDTAATEAVGDVFKLVMGTFTDIQVVEITVDDNVYYLSADNSQVYIPVGANAEVEVFPVAGYALSTASIGTVNGNTVSLPTTYAVGEEVTLDLTATKVATGNKVVSIDAPIIDRANGTVTYLISTAGFAAEDFAKLALDVTINGGVLDDVKLEDLKTAHKDSATAFGIQISDEDGLGLITADDYTVELKYNDTVIAETDGYYVVE